MEEFRTVALSDCYPSPLQNRKRFDEAALKDLTDSVAAKGVLTPLLVRQNPTGEQRYEILAGERRFKAATAAALTEVPVRVCNLTDGEAHELVVIENVQREDLHPLEEADGYQALLDRPGYDVASLAAKVGKSESYVYQRLNLLDLIKPAKDAFLADAITAGHAKLIARLPADVQQEALKHCFEERWVGDKRVRTLVSTRSLSAYIESEIQLDLHAASFPKDDDALLPKAGACTACPKRSGYAPALFQDLAKKDVCLDRDCFKAKQGAQLKRVQDETAAGGEKAVSITTEWYTNTKGVLSSNAYADASGKKKCASSTKGIVVEGPKLGRVMDICTDKQCKVHRPHAARASSESESYRAQQRKREAKERQAAEARRRIFAAVRDAAPKKLGRDELQRVALAFVDEMQNEARKVFAQAVGVAVGKSYDCDKALHKWIRELDDPSLAQCLALLPLAADLQGQHWNSGASKGFLRAAAKSCGVNAAAIDRAVATEAKERASKKAKRAKKSAAKGTKATPAKAKGAKKAKKAARA